MMNRRHFLGAAVTLPFAFKAMAVQTVVSPRWVLLGTDKGKGIYRAPWDPATGTLGKIELAIDSERPDYFAMHPRLPILYSVNSLSGGKGAVSSFAVDTRTGSLTFLDKASSLGDGPCYVSLNHSGRTLYLANYNGGTFSIRQLTEKGGFTNTTEQFGPCPVGAPCKQLGPNKDRQESEHMHCAVVSPDGAFVLVCDLGSDKILLFNSELTTGEAAPKPAIEVRARPGSGPRHVAFHPSGRWVYCIHELDATIDVYSWSVLNGVPTIKLLQNSVVSTLAKGTPLKGNTGCEVLVGDNGTYVTVCNRGVDDIVVYHVDPATGLLTELQRVGSGGKVPRIIAFDPSRKWLVACNQAGDGTVAVFAHDPQTGHLSETPKVFPADTPMFIQWI